MNDPASIPCVYASLPAAAILFAQSIGVERATMLDAAGLTEDDLSDPDNLVDYDCLIGIWTLLRSRFPDEPLGLRYASLIPVSAFGAVGYVMAHCRTAEQAVQAYLRYYRLLDPFLTVKREAFDDQVRIRLDHEPRAIALIEPMELIVGSTFRLAKELVKIEPRGASVSFRHAQRHPDEVYEAFFGVPVHFEADWLGFQLDADLLQLEVPTADPALGRFLRAHLDQQLATRAAPRSTSFVDAVRHEIEARVEEGEGIQAAVAAALHVSPRTLQRRLGQEGARFSELVDEVRRERALGLLGLPDLSVQEVAYLLGYSEPRAFHRSFKRWTGTSPGAWRKDGAR